MSGKSNDFEKSGTGARRCPLFKINPGGRFVYVDDLTEKLLGLPQEELFGRSIQDFFDEASYSILKDILRQGRHYETFFKAAELDFIDAAGNHHRRWAVISLNFIAGNPANFQVVIYPGDSPAESKVAPVPVRLEEMLFNFIAGLAPGSGLDELCRILLNVDQVVQCGLYIFTGQRLQLVGSACRPEQITAEIDLAKPPEWLKKTVWSRRSVAVEAASEAGFVDGNQLTDIGYPLICRDDGWGAIRLIAETDIEDSDYIQNIARFLGIALYSYLIEAGKEAVVF